VNVSVNELRTRFLLEGQIRKGNVPAVEAVDVDKTQVKCPACRAKVERNAIESTCIDCGLKFPIKEIISGIKYDCPKCGVVTDDEVIASPKIDEQLCINCGEAVAPHIKRTPKRKRAPGAAQSKTSGDSAGGSLSDAIKKDKKNKFEMIDNDKDATLNFGQFKGSKLSELTKSKRGRGYMRWMLEENFPSYLKDAIRLQLNNHDGD